MRNIPHVSEVLRGKVQPSLPNDKEEHVFKNVFIRRIVAESITYLAPCGRARKQSSAPPRPYLSINSSAMRFFPILLLVFCLCSCGADNATEPSVAAAKPETNVTSTPEANDLITGLLDGYPAELVESGCGCSLRPENGKDDELFFVFDWQGNGGGKMRINDKDVVLQRGASLKTGNQNYDSYLHQNKKWTVKTSLTNQGSAGDEGSIFTGKVKISNRRTGVKKEVRVKGVCSC